MRNGLLCFSLRVGQAHPTQYSVVPCARYTRVDPDKLTAGKGMHDFLSCFAATSCTASQTIAGHCLLSGSAGKLIGVKHTRCINIKVEKSPVEHHLQCLSAG